MLNGVLITVGIFAAFVVLVGLAVVIGKWLESRHEPKRWWWV